MKTERNFTLLYEDRDLLAVWKKGGLLTIGTEKDKEHNLYHYVREYANLHRERIFIVHRLDKDTSGIVLFAKNYPLKEVLQDEFAKHTVKRYYEAVVKEKLPLGWKKKVVQYLSYDPRSGLVRVTKNPKEGKEAITLVTTDRTLPFGTALRIEILTGRQHQIRLALHSLGYTLIGDDKYAHDKNKRMYLNEYELDLPSYLHLKQHRFALAPLWITDRKSEE